MSAGGAPRIATLDLIRGVAVMGILLMNIQSFAMPEAAYSNPLAFGGRSGVDLATWAAEFVLVDGRMRGLFSWLFGASMLLVIERAEASSRSGAASHGRRMGWLLLFGIAHLLLVWDGDILVHYALVGSAAFAFRRKPPHRLVAAALALLVAQIALVSATPVGVELALAEVRGGHPSAAALDNLASLRDQFGVPAPATIARSVALHRGSYAGLVASRVADAPGIVLGTLWSFGFETLAYMLLGMAGLKSGMLTGEWPRHLYARLARIAFGIAIPAYGLLAGWLAWRGFGLSATIWTVTVLTAPFRPVMIAGWACLIVLLARPGGWLTTRVSAAGRMAFSNYLGTSLICATLFYGQAPGWFGRFSRAELLVVVAAIWALMLWWSRPWLARFRYGPLEWLWRSLARGRIEPLRGAAA